MAGLLRGTRVTSVAACDENVSRRRRVYRYHGNRGGDGGGERTGTAGAGVGARCTWCQTQLAGWVSWMATQRVVVNDRMTGRDGDGAKARGSPGSDSSHPARGVRGQHGQYGQHGQRCSCVWPGSWPPAGPFAFEQQSRAFAFGETIERRPRQNLRRLPSAKRAICP